MHEIVLSVIESHIQSPLWRYLDRTQLESAACKQSLRLVQLVNKTDFLGINIDFGIQGVFFYKDTLFQTAVCQQLK